MKEFADIGSGTGIGWALVEDINNAVIQDEIIIDELIYHTINEGKNGIGPAPIKTNKGWLNLAHGVRYTAAGFRYVLYLFLADLNDPSKVINKPAGYFIAPEGDERVGDVSNVVFSNGWVASQGSRRRAQEGLEAVVRLPRNAGLSPLLQGTCWDSVLLIRKEEIWPHRGMDGYSRRVALRLV